MICVVLGTPLQEESLVESLRPCPKFVRKQWRDFSKQLIAHAEIYPRSLAVHRLPRFGLVVWERRRSIVVKVKLIACG